MGLRFRKSITIFPGVKINLSKSGVSLSAGIPGFRKTFHSSGRQTTTFSLPGTGLSYVTTKNKKKDSKKAKEDEAKRETSKKRNNKSDVYDEAVKKENSTKSISNSSKFKSVNKQVAFDIHKVADEEINWSEFRMNELPPDDSYDEEIWAYFHNAAKDIMAGDIDTYLQVINDINPLNDLLEYGTGFEFGTDSPLKMEVEFAINDDAIDLDKKSKDYQDYVCSVSIRIARDMFALLPIQNVVVHATDNMKDILSVCFDRNTFTGLRFNMIDPSNTVEGFTNSMNFTEKSGFKTIERLEI